MGNESKTLRDLLAGVITGNTISIQNSTATDLIRMVVGTSGTSLNVNLVGGTSGGAGTSGTSGGAGTSGTSGGAGTSGTSGGAGTSGTSGENGSSGTSGINGIDASGTNGTSGTSGLQGLNFLYMGMWVSGNTYNMNEIVRWTWQANPFWFSTFLSLIDTNTSEPYDTDGNWSIVVLDGEAGSSGTSGDAGTSGTSGGGGSGGYTIITSSIDVTGTTLKYYRLDTSGSTLYLPAAIGGGEWIIFKNISGGSVIIQPIGSDKVDGNIFKNTNSNDSFTLVDGASEKWEIL